MRIFFSALVLISLLFNSGCAIYQKETTNRGGYLDAVIDDHWMKADSKAMRALRAFAIEVSLARIASVSAKNDSDRQLLAIRIGALTKRFVPIYMCAFGSNPLAVPGAEADPCFYYDSAMVDYSTGLFDLAMIALPIEDGQKLVSTITGSFVNPINIVDLLNTLLQIGKDALKYGRVVGALYRDTVELEVQLWLTTPAVDNRPPPYRVTLEDVRPLANVYARQNDDMPAWLAEMAALRGRGLEPIPQAKFYYELGALMSYICGLITSDSATKTSCQANLPDAKVNPAPVLGRSLVTFRIGDPSTMPKGGGGGARQSKGGGTSQQQQPGTDQSNQKNPNTVNQNTNQQPQKKSGEILLGLMRNGTADDKKKAQGALQGFLLDAEIKRLLDAIPDKFFSNRANIRIEEIAIATDPAFDAVQAHLVQMARNQGLLKK
jgi:hypothetical protein